MCSIIQFYIFPQIPDFSRTGRRFSDSVRGKPISSAVFKVRSRPGRSFCASSNLSIPNKRGKPITERREGEVRERNGVTKSEAIGSGSAWSADRLPTVPPALQLAPGQSFAHCSHEEGTDLIFYHVIFPGSDKKTVFLRDFVVLKTVSYFSFLQFPLSRSWFLIY